LIIYSMGTFDRIAKPTHSNPILSAMQFASQTAKTGGASMNLKSGRVISPGDPGHFVGGEPDSSGQRIPTAKHAGDLSPMDVLSHRQRLQAKTSASHANMGAWKDDGKTEIDASGSYANKRTAMKVGKRREEKAIWDNQNSKEIRL
jgi:hypothetical protein